MFRDENNPTFPELAASPVAMFKILEEEAKGAQEVTLEETEGKIDILLGQVIKAHRKKLEEDALQFQTDDRWAEGFVEGIEYAQSLLNSFFHPSQKVEDVFCKECNRKLTGYDRLYRGDMCILCEGDKVSLIFPTKADADAGYEELKRRARVELEREYSEQSN